VGAIYRKKILNLFLMAENKFKNNSLFPLSANIWEIFCPKPIKIKSARVTYQHGGATDSL
jgi:hypothetical protein